MKHDGWGNAHTYWAFKQWVRLGCIRWYPHRETVESISPNAISPYAWGFNSPERGLVNVSIWNPRKAAYYIKLFEMLVGYQTEAVLYAADQAGLNQS